MIKMALLAHLRSMTSLDKYFPMKEPTTSYSTKTNIALNRWQRTASGKLEGK